MIESRSKLCCSVDVQVCRKQLCELLLSCLRILLFDHSLSQKMEWNQPKGAKSNDEIHTCASNDNAAREARFSSAWSSLADSALLTSLGRLQQYRAFSASSVATSFGFSRTSISLIALRWVSETSILSRESDRNAF